MRRELSAPLRDNPDQPKPLSLQRPSTLCLLLHPLMGFIGIPSKS
jgi:hypothetical protein